MLILHLCAELFLMLSYYSVFSLYGPSSQRVSSESHQRMILTSPRMTDNRCLLIVIDFSGRREKCKVKTLRKIPLFDILIQEQHLLYS